MGTKNRSTKRMPRMQNQKMEQMSNSIAKLMCKVCHKRYNAITNSHLAKHGLTPTEYRSKFNCITSRWQKIFTCPICGKHFWGFKSRYQSITPCCSRTCGRQMIEREIPVNEYYFDKLTHSSAYILGFIAADGNLNDSKYIHSLQISVNVKDIWILNFIKNQMKSGHKLFYYKDKPICSLSIGSIKLFDSLVRNGITPRKSLILKYPNIPRKFDLDFIRGYCDGDGCINIRMLKGRYKQLRVNILGTNNFLDSIKKILPGGHISKRLDSKIFSLDYYCKNAVNFCKRIYYRDDLPCLERKHAIYRRYAG